MERVVQDSNVDQAYKGNYNRSRVTQTISSDQLYSITHTTFALQFLLKLESQILHKIY